MTESERGSCPWHSGLKSDITHLNDSDRDQWDAITGLRNKLDNQTRLLVATLAGIVASLLMQALRCLPFILLFAFSAHAATVTLALNPNSTTDPAGYHLYYGLESGGYTASVDLGARTRDVKFEIQIDLLPGNIYYFAATAYDAQKNESAFSSEVAKAFMPTPPKITSMLEIKP